jgi:type II restriction enzyme
MPILNKEQAKKALDTVIRKSRVHLYKPIQIAEILYRSRTEPQGLDLANLESYRNHSKRWRDEISRDLLGRVCTSSQKFQDNLFEANATPPDILVALGKENQRTKGAVEAYIYRQFTTKHTQLSAALSYCLNATKADFDVSLFIDSFWKEAGLKRSIDKIYEIVVYALFSTLVTALDLQVQVSINADKKDILNEFSDFAKMVMGLDADNVTYNRNARVYRVGVTNAADRGLDMYSNWGPAIQIKHLSLDEELAEHIVNSVASDQIVIVCKSVEKATILSLLTQLGWRSRIQSIVTETDLVSWYKKALRGTYADTMGDELLSCLCEEIANEFPSVYDMPEALKARHYEDIRDSFWA